MHRMLCGLALGAVLLSGCGSDAGNGSALPGAGGGFPGGAGRAGGAVPGATGGAAVGLGTGGSNTVGAGGAPSAGGALPMSAGGMSTLGAGGSPEGGAPAAGGAPSAGGASMGGTGAGGAADGGAAGMGGMGGMTVKPPCLKDPSEVVFLGDSYVNYDVAHPALQLLVAQDAVKDGALMNGQAYRSYAVAGATMAAASLNMIPPQWTNAKNASKDVITVIMTGGGNDVLINNPQCKNPGSQNDATCKQVVNNTVMAVGNLIDDFKKTGVTDLIYFFYPHAPTGGDDISDYARGILDNSAMLLSDAAFRMYVVNLVPLFQNHPEYFYLDGIHANAQGEQVIADAIYQVMKDHCIDQPASSGCCMP